MSDRFGVIDPSALGDMTVIEIPDPELILQSRMDAFKARWLASDPEFAAEYDVGGIEFDPARVAMTVGTSYETNLRSRVNQAARDTTLAFGFGRNLDAIASRFPGGVPRLALVENPRDFDAYPEDWESDDRYRKRIWLAPNALSTAGSKEGYEFWALTAVPTLRDVTATLVKTGDGPVVRITCLNGDTSQPTPPDDQLLAVRKTLDRPDVRPLTDVVTVGGPQVIDTEYLAWVYLYPGPDRSTIEDQLNKRLASYLEKCRYLGKDHTDLAFAGLLNIDGITHSAVRKAPAKTILANDTQFIRVVGTPQVVVRPERME